MEESLPVIQFTHRTTGEVRVGHFHPPSTKLPSEWTDGYGNRVAAPTDVTEWIAGGGGGGGGGGGEGAPVGATYITQTPSDGLTAEQALSALATGILKNTTTTGVLSIATGSDLPSHSHVLTDVTDAGTIASQDADSVVITGGSLENVTVTTGTYSSKVNETLMHAVRKASAGTITKGQVIRITGSSGMHLLCELADATDEATSSKTIAIAATEITTTSGYMMVQGELTGLSNVPTASFTNGQALWLSETTGEFTQTKPTQPAHGVFLGWVVNANNGSAGRIFVKIINYQELDELHDVLISGIADKQILVWDDVAKLWKNQEDKANVITEAGTTVALSASNAWPNVIRCTSASDITATLTAGQNVIGRYWILRQVGLGRITIAATNSTGGAVTRNGSFLSFGQHSSLSAMIVSENVLDLEGGNAL